jgi:hypothetical protein
MLHHHPSAVTVGGCRGTDLQSVCSDPDDVIPMTVTEALDCALPLAEMFSLLSANIIPAANADEVLANATPITIEDIYAEMGDDEEHMTYRRFIELGHQALVTKGLDTTQTFHAVRITGDRAEAGEQRWSLLPFFLAVGLVLAGNSLHKAVCVYLPPSFLGVPGTHITLRKWLRLNFPQDRQTSGRSPNICPNDVLYCLFNTALTLTQT